MPLLRFILGTTAEAGAEAVAEGGEPVGPGLGLDHLDLEQELADILVAGGVDGYDGHNSDNDFGFD